MVPRSPGFRRWHRCALSVEGDRTSEGVRAGVGSSRDISVFHAEPRDRRIASLLSLDGERGGAIQTPCAALPALRRRIAGGPTAVFRNVSASHCQRFGRQNSFSEKQASGSSAPVNERGYRDRFAHDYRRNRCGPMRLCRAACSQGQVQHLWRRRRRVHPRAEPSIEFSSGCALRTKHVARAKHRRAMRPYPSPEPAAINFIIDFMLRFDYKSQRFAVASAASNSHRF
jgi:hypothetical protein